MNKILGIIILCLLLSSKAFAESEKCKSFPKYSNNWYYNNCDKQNSKVKTWGKNRNIPEEYKRPNLETLRHHFLAYNKRGRSYKFYTKPSSQPAALKFKLQKEPKIIKKIVKKMESKALISYLMYEDGEIVIDQLSPPERFGDLINNDTMIYSHVLRQKFRWLPHGSCDL